MKSEYIKPTKASEEAEKFFQEPILSTINSCIDFFVQEERKRCANIISKARMGEIDSDLRSLLNRINKP